MVMRCLNFFEQVDSNESIPNDLDGLGYLLEVDIEYAKIYSKYKNDFPLAADKIEIKK